MKLAMLLLVSLAACAQDSTPHVGYGLGTTGLTIIDSGIPPAILEVRGPTGSLVSFNLSEEELKKIASDHGNPSNAAAILGLEILRLRRECSEPLKTGSNNQWEMVVHPGVGAGENLSIPPNSALMGVSTFNPNSEEPK